MGASNTGATLSVWEAIREHYGVAITLTQPRVAPDFAFLDSDHDGRIRMDCSSEHAMASVIAKRHDFDLVVANDADGDRHGIVDAGGLLTEAQGQRKSENSRSLETVWGNCCF